MEKLQPSEVPAFRTPEEELEFLRGKVYENTASSENRAEQQSSVRKTIDQYKNTATNEVLSSKMQLSDKKLEKIVLNLSPEEHDAKIEELIGILQEKGIKNALDVVARLNDHHIEDDFHRFLVQYLKQGFPIDGLKEKNSLYRALHMTLFEIALPKGDKQSEEKTLKEFIGSMEQFYAGMLSISDDKKHADGRERQEGDSRRPPNQVRLQPMDCRPRPCPWVVVARWTGVFGRRRNVGSRFRTDGINTRL